MTLYHFKSDLLICALFDAYNTIVLKTGDSIEIVEPSTLPMKDRVMYKLQHEQDRVVISRENGKMVIPMDNIMFSSSIPLDIIHEDFDDEI